MGSKNNKTIIFGIIILMIGIAIGSLLEKYSIKELQGYLLNSIGYATSSNATNSNATPSNATSSNATSGNATSSNATDSNASLQDNILYLSEFDFKSLETKPNNKVYIHLLTVGAPLKDGTIVIYNEKLDITYSLKIYSIISNPYIEIPNNILQGTYQLKEILLIGINSNNNTFSKRYSYYDNADHALSYLNKKITIKTDSTTTTTQKTTKPVTTTTTTTTTQKITNPVTTTTKVIEKLKLEILSINKLEFNTSDKVYINYKANNVINNLKLIFKNDINEKLTVYVKSMNEDPYFEIPTETKEGKYTLYSVTLSNEDTTIIYCTDNTIKETEKLNYDISLTINNKEEPKLYIYNNEEIAMDNLSELYELEDYSEIKINIDSKSIIMDELFNIIKGTNKKLIINNNDNETVFIGKDIKESKSIDGTIKIQTIENDSDISKLLNEGYIVEYADNGQLPGKAVARIKITNEMKEFFRNESLHVYYYNQTQNKFKPIATDVIATKEGYYEFYINHNSKYVLVKNTISNDLLEEVEDNIADFQKSDKTYILILTIVFIIVFTIIIAVFIINRKKTKQPSINNMN